MANAKVQRIHKKTRTGLHKFEILFVFNGAKIRHVNESEKEPLPAHDFTSLTDLDGLSNGSYCTVVAVINQVGDASEVTRSNCRETVTKQVVELLG